MFAGLDAAPRARDTDVIARTVGALALAALAVIHVVDLPGTLGPTPLVGFGYFGIIAAAVVTGAAMIARSHWLAWAVAAAVAFSAMGGYVLTRALGGGFLGDHGDVGNWRCPLGIAAPTAGAGVSGKVRVLSDAHGRQVTYNGHPLYTFIDDHAGQVSGQGVSDFFVAAPGLAPITGSPAAPAPAAPAGGYSY